MALTESQPLLRTEENSIDDGLADLDRPEQWSSAYRWSIVALLAFQAFTVTFTAISVVPVASHIVSDLNGSQGNPSDSVLLVTIWELGEAAGPLLIAPLSEVYGRYLVFNIGNILFISGIVLSALCRSVDLFILARFLTGLAVTSGVLNPAVIGDIFPAEERGTAMSVVMLAPLLGGAIGPAVAGTIAQTAGWRRIIWMALGLAVSCELAFLTMFRETYKVVLLKRNKRVLEAVECDDDESPVIKAVHETESALWASIVRPASVFTGSLVLQILSLYGSLVFTFFYIMSTTLPDILQNMYNFPPSLVGSSFLIFSVGSVFGLIVCNRLLDRIYKQARDAKAVKPPPEARLPLVIFGALIFPIIVALYGWSAQFVLPIPVMLLIVGAMGFGLMLTMLPLTAYVVDAFGLYSASALTGLLITRCLAGTFLPLITAPLKEMIGWGWAFTVWAAACAVLAPVPFLVWKYGKIWRQRSEYTNDQ
ncbi:MFS multidrug transporter-like protein [Pleomassaria siparia CBS 279.74]|uniref:MFS multidrug transporter-like protein n=1 Tax=Pleomassaria siparia CBS 279.74 TaxID=1314801 RepID=A0A6G1JWX5_9PLEO|nr:MFS multidrug transporter-like protein [Pleomassaria siparia CBS 279.74]